MNPLLMRLIDKTDPTASLKHLAYGVVVGCSCIWLTGSLIGSMGVMSQEWVASLALVLAAVTTGKVVGSAPSPAPTVGVAAPPAPGGLGVVPESPASGPSDGGKP